MRVRQQIQCKTCAEYFYPKSGNLKQINCSRSCAVKWRVKNGGTTKGKTYPHRYRAAVRKCLVCEQDFRAVKDFKERKQKYCSKDCWSIRGTITILKKVCKTCNKDFQTYDKRKMFCNSECGYNRPESEQPAWKGDGVSYSGLHKWVAARLGKPKECEFCHTIVDDPKAIHWANKSQEYKRDLSDWLRLCRKCHMEYDDNSIEKSMRRKRAMV